MSRVDQALPSTSVEEALELLLEQVPRLAAQEYPLLEAEGLALAAPVVATAAHPSHNVSAMDGYAVKFADLANASLSAAVNLELIEDVKAGFAPQRSVLLGQTSRISTGALIPAGADAVVMRELVEVSSDGRVVFYHPCSEGENIRFAGEHLEKGEQVLEAGRVLGPAEMGMVAFLGLEKVLCYPKVPVAILATGSELVSGSGALEKGQIYDSNSVALAASLRKLGCEVSLRVCVPDDPLKLDEALEKAFAISKVVITSGGISAGWHDLVRERIENQGGVFEFHKLRMRPGKPLAFGHSPQAHFFCLPGNPVSSFVTFEVFVKPALMKMMGRPHSPKTGRAKLAHDIEKKRGFSIFFRGILKNVSDEKLLSLTGPQGSHIFKSVVQANVLIKTPEDVEVLEAGSEVEYFVL